MKWLPLLILVVFWFTDAQDDSCKGICGRRPLASSHGGSMRIVGGTNALPGTWPAIVSFQFPTRKGFKHFCSGSLINSRWVLTTSHCFAIKRYLKVEYWRVLIGATQQSKPGPDAQTRSFKRIVEHEQYKRMGHFNDIALVELDQPVICNDYIQPACLPEDNLTLADLTHCYVSGWGITDMKKSRTYEYTDILQEARVDLMPTEICNSSSWYYTRIREENLCAVSKKGAIDSCRGDGGGPLMCRTGRTERFWLVGLNSWGSGCAQARMPGVFTATHNFHYWIQRTMKNPPEPVTEPPTTTPQPYSSRWTKFTLPTQTYGFRPPDIVAKYNLPYHIMYIKPRDTTRAPPKIITQTFQNWNGQIGVIYRLSKPRPHETTTTMSTTEARLPGKWVSRPWGWEFVRSTTFRPFRRLQYRSGGEDYSS